MLICEWKPFSTDLKMYNQDEFEKMMDDTFEAMQFEQNDEIPSIIWTKNYVCLIKKNARIINDISITKIPRNPKCSQLV
ncbi:hypothetical protein [Bacillus testis]|uniref:hypothetical protein n=1 Tax=Bacillus testis TaxID=1622072 RepID=UPI00067EF5FF|nr:hypothetical protein [Bacillus testis]